MSLEFDFQFVDSMSAISRADWNRLVSSDCPFLDFNFVSALEATKVASAETGWRTNHLQVTCGGKLIAIILIYIKDHPYGEYVFDYQWANAYHQLGINYYPKLLTALPFTPVQGPRLFIDKGFQNSDFIIQLVDRIQQFLLSNGYQTWHVLFNLSEEAGWLEDACLIKKLGLQYHWFNRNYQSFDDFLTRCRKKHRNNIKRERRRIVEQGIDCQMICGKDIDSSLWETFYGFYQNTYIKRSGHQGYLSLECFQAFGRLMANNLLMFIARDTRGLVAASLLFKDSESLYGRYWGARADYEFLHFELCYYQGIEYCIKHNLKRFDAGAQGEHKIQRGFEPVLTGSSHLIADNKMRSAIAAHTLKENDYTLQLKTRLEGKLPFRREG